MGACLLVVCEQYPPQVWGRVLWVATTEIAASPQPQALDERPSPLAAASAAATRAKAAIKEAPRYTNLPPPKAALPKVVSPKPLAQKRLVFEEGVQGWRMIEI